MDIKNQIFKIVFFIIVLTSCNSKENLLKEKIYSNEKDSLRSALRSAEIRLKFASKFKDSLAFENYNKSINERGNSYPSDIFISKNSKFIYWTPVNNEPLEIDINIEQLRLLDNNQSKWNNLKLVLKDDDNGALYYDYPLEKNRKIEIKNNFSTNLNFTGTEGSPTIVVKRMKLLYYPRNKKEYEFTLEIRDNETHHTRTWSKIISNTKKSN